MGRLFAGIGMQEIAAHPSPEATVLAGFIQQQQAWVAESGGPPAEPRWTSLNIWAR